MKQHWRIWLMFAAVVCFAFILTGKLYHVQVVSGQAYKERAEDQYIRPNYHDFSRGDVFFQDRNGDRIPLATVRSGYLLAIDPESIEQPRRVAEMISEITEIDTDRFVSLAERGVNYAEVTRRIPEEKAIAIRELELEGVQLHSHTWRYYPGERVASHTIGYYGHNEENVAGRYGLERQYEDVLHRPSQSVTVNSFANVFGGFVGSDPSEREGDIYTTLEPYVQATLEQELRDLEEQWDVREAGMIVMNPSTGAIYALGALPDFDPNNYGSEDQSTFNNPLVESVYEMGSIIKPLTMAAGIDAGVVTPDSTYVDHGSIDIDGYTISNHDGQVRGRISMQDVLEQSVNTGVVHVMDRLGTQTFAEYMERFGLREKTEIDLPNETENLVRSFESPRRVEYATAAFGQGVAFTPIGTIRALSSLANGGKVVHPHVVDRIEYSNGESEDLYSESSRRSIDPGTSETITWMLVKTYDDALLHGDVKMENYSIAAKTGTAQIPDPVHGGYKENEFLHSFFGYFPAYDPEFIILIYGVAPQGPGGQYASQTLTEPFVDMVSFLINHYAVTPDR